MRVLLVFMLIIAIPNYGQIVINQEDMPQVGDVLTFSVGTTVVNDPAETISYGIIMI
jgi:hypothetical protein